MTRVSNAKMALEYINASGGSAYLPRRMVEKDIESSLLHEVVDAPTSKRRAFAAYPVGRPRLELIQECVDLIPV